MYSCIVMRRLSHRPNGNVKTIEIHHMDSVMMMQANMPQQNYLLMEKKKTFFV